MASRRFIKLYDKIVSWEWFSHPNTLALFIYLLLKANYKNTRSGGRIIKRGQVLTSLPKISTDVGLTIQQARTALLHLKSTGEITDESTNQYRIITIVKYDQYQSPTDDSTGNQQANNRQLNRQSTDDSTPCIEYIEQNRKEVESIESLPSGERGASRFTPPAKEEVFDFCLAEGIGIDVDRFFDYYSSNGWKVGRSSMKDWRAACRNWARRDKEQQPSRPASGVKRVIAQEYGQRDYNGENDEAMRRMMEMMRGSG